MKMIPVKGGNPAIVDDEDYHLVSRFDWFTKRKADNWTYAWCFLPPEPNGKHPCVRMHRLIVGAKDGESVDHRNGNSLDNRRQNLRICTASQNQQNRRVILGVSKYKGVCWHKKHGKWQSQIKINGKTTYLGLFKCEVEAAEAYDRAAKEYFGDFAATNTMLLGAI